MSATPQLPVLVPEIPTDATLPAIFAERLDWVALAESINGIDGKALVDQGAIGEAVAQQLKDEYKEIKAYRVTFKDWWEHDAKIKINIPALNAMLEVGVQPLIDIADRLDRVRLDEERRCDLACGARDTILGAQDIELKHRSAIKRAADEAKQRQEAAADKQRQLDDLAAQRAAAVEDAQPDEAIVELDAQIEQVEAEPVLPVAVSLKATAASIFKAPAGRARKDVCWRTVKRDREGLIDITELQKLFTFLGSAAGRAVIVAACRVKSVERGSDIITLPLSELKKDMTTEYPGLKNARGSEA